jgi:tetratricopeptide (TPR) repeat protein
MDRIKISKILYILVIALCSLSVLYIYTRINSPYNLIFLIIVCIAFLIPGRIQRYYYKDFYTGRKLLSRNRYEQSVEYFESFLQQIKQRPWIKKMIWFSWGIYTNDIEVMTYNNMGVAMLYLRQYNQSKEYLTKALKLDSRYPLPYHNLAILFVLEGNMVLAEKYYNDSVDLGYKGTSFDKFISKVGTIYANIQGEKL